MADKKSNVNTTKHEPKKLVDNAWKRKDEDRDKSRISSTR